MPAYMIVTARISDRDAFISGYGKAAGALVDKFGGKYVLRAPGGVTLEGPDSRPPSMVISEWPDMEALRRFWESPEYSEAKKLREGLADCQVIAIEAPKINE